MQEHGSSGPHKRVSFGGAETKSIPGRGMSVNVKRLPATLLAAAAVMGALAAPAMAQNRQEGLVNVAVEDVTVQLPIAVAANICDLNVAVLAEIADEGGTCEATADSAASAGRSGSGSTRQDGLVNVLVDDVVVQAPIALAANVCDVNVAVLATVLDDSSACEAQSGAEATTPGAGGGGRRASAAAFEPVDLDLEAGLALLDNDLTTDRATPFPPL